MSRILFAFLAICLVFSQPSHAQSLAITYDKFTLDNGLTVIVHEDRKAPIVGVAVWYKVGSKDEPEGKTGFAHLFEHLMFNGTENYDDEWFKPLQEVGATGLNGTTSFDYTNYFQTVPTTALDRILWMESDRMGHLLGAVTQEKLDEQRGVVQNEKRQGEDAPYGKAFTHIVKGLFPIGHPYHHLPIGSMADLNNASLEDVKAWFEEYYGAANAILVLSGDINVAETKPLVEKYFGDIASGPALAKWESWVPKRTENSKVVAYDKVPQARVYRLWATPEVTSPVATDLQIAASVLGDGKNSRLYKTLVYDKQMATSVSVFSYGLKMASMFGVIVDVAEGVEVDDVEQEMDRVIAEFLQKGPTNAEVALVATKEKASTLRGLEEVGGFSGKAVTLAYGELMAGNPGFVNQQLLALDKAERPSVKRAANAWLKDGYFQLNYLPFPEYSTTAGMDRSAGLPDVTGETTLNFPEVIETTLDNGMKLVFAQRNTVPLVNVAVQFDAGYSADAGGKLGRSALVSRVLDEGAGTLDALELAATLEGLGATLSVGSNIDATNVIMSMLAENMTESLAILADVLVRPTFDNAEIERQRALLLSNIAQGKVDPVTIGFTVLPPMIFGEGHSYAIPFTGNGTSEDVSSLTRDELIAFKNTWIRPDNATVIVVGATELSTIKAQLNKTLGKWSVDGLKGQKVITTVDLPETNRVVIVDRPGSQQSMILAAHVAPSSKVDNNIAIESMNSTLGGEFTARINMNLREDKGWAYGAYTFLQPSNGQRPFMVYAPVQTDKTGLSLAELINELNAYKGDKPPTTGELERVVFDATRSLPGQYETAYDVLSSFINSTRFGREYNYPETVAAKYTALTLEDLRAAAEEVVHPDKLTWVIIGDASAIKEDVEAVLGDVEIKSMTDL